MPGKRILIVDDEPDILRVVVFRLRKAGFEVLTATDGKAGLETAKKERPDLIFLDLRLPLMNGYEVCAEIRRDHEMDKTPVIFLSASADENIGENVRKYGADGYIRKPFEPEELFAKIKEHTGTGE